MNFIFTQDICLLFSKPVYPTMTGKICGVQVTGKCNFESKN